MSDWSTQLWDRLAEAQNPDGGWGYRASLESAPEPTAWACMALALQVGRADSARAAASFLRSRQEADGSVRAVRERPTSAWPTALTLLAWRAAAQAELDGFAEAADRATQWLLKEAGKPFASDATVYGHNTELVGWPWITGTHTWTEPTACALLALRATGHASHARCEEGVRILCDRAVLSGGWNYGNPRMFGADLRSFPETTGLALAALAGRKRDTMVDRGLNYLSATLTDARSPIALSWAVIGLDAWNQRPADADILLHRAAEEMTAASFAPQDAALLLIASEQPSVLKRIVSGDLAGAPA